MESVAANAQAHGDGLIIETPTALDEFLASLPPPGPQRRCAIDTEADSLHSYREKLCLIQFSCADSHAIIDPLRINDLSGLLKFLQESEVWMHGADFDMSLFRRTFDTVPSRVLDTQVAARLCGHRQFGLAHLVQEVFGVSLSKHSQRANWGRRPLAPQMVEYALNDVRYILPLAERFLARLAQIGRLEWFEQSCTAARELVLQRNPPDSEEAWRITGWGNLQPRGLAALRAFWEWRNREAERLDRPAFKVLNNEPLLEMARVFQEGGTPELAARFPYPAQRRFQQAVESIRKQSPEQWPKRRLSKKAPKLPEAEPRFDHLRAHRDKIASSLDIEGSLIAPRGLLEEIAQDANAATHLLPWQRDLMEQALGNLPPLGTRFQARKASRKPTDTNGGEAGGGA
ncbi:MAG: ribonuclease D [Verrucomicrobiales bacterium]